MIPSPTTTRPKTGPAPGKVRTNPLGWLFADPLLRPAWRFCVAVMVVAGPWLIVVLTLGLIAALMAPVLGRAGVEDLILTVVYAFCIAPLFAVPVGVIAARRVTIAIEAGAESTVTELYIVAAVFSGLATGAGALVICLLLGIHPIGHATAFVFSRKAPALLWTSFAVDAAIRANGVMIGAFGGGRAFAMRVPDAARS